MAWNPFWNPSERRMRALWRLLVQIILLVPLVLAFVYLLSPAVGPIFGSILGSLTGITLSVWLAGRFLDRRAFTGFGLRLTPAWWADFGFGLALGVLLMGAVFLFEWQMGWLTVTAVFQDRSAAAFPVVFAGTLLIFGSVGFYEELLSRGYHVKNVAEGLSGSRIGPHTAVWLALFLSSVVFGLAHALNPNASFVSTVHIVLAGMFLGLGYVLTGRLGLSIGLHVTWNFAQGVLFGFPVSGSDAFTAAQVLVIEQSGPVAWTGGAFGPEAGWLGLLAMGLGTASITAWVNVRYGLVSVCEDIAAPPLDDDEKYGL